MAKEKKQMFNLRDGWLKLSPKEQQGVTTFFNLHNAANFVFESLSSEGKAYIEATIKLNEDVIKKEKKMLKEQGAQES